jgi:hypothetical protein
MLLRQLALHMLAGFYMFTRTTMVINRSSRVERCPFERRFVQ